MRVFLALSAALAMTLGAAGSAAQAQVSPGALTCMANSYTDEQEARLTALFPSFDVASEQANPVTDEIVGIAGSAVGVCSEKLGWSDDPSGNAVIFEFSRLSEIAYRRFGPLTGEELGKIDGALAEGDRTSLWNAMESQVLVGLTGRPSATQQRDEMIAGMFLTEIGMIDLNKAEQVGLLLGFIALQRYAAREFAALQ